MSTQFLYINAKLILAQPLGGTTDYEKWHRRLGHISDKNIQDTIKHLLVVGLEELLLEQTTYEKHTYKVYVMHDWKECS